MRKINRDAVATPLCLASGSGRSYADLRGAEKNEIRVALLTVQGHRCAYCERRTGSGSDDGHIEHFRKQADHPDLDMTWTNMFWSCNDEKTCGKSKDKCERVSGPKARFNCDDLMNPDLHDPDEFFLFVTDGSVQMRPGLSEDKQLQAQETLRVFQLAESAYLRKAREDAVKPYVNIVASLLLMGPAVVRQYVQAQKSTVDAAPFSVAIRQFFVNYCP